MSEIQHECQRCSSDEWTWCDYRGCSECFEPEIPPERDSASGLPDDRPLQRPGLTIPLPYSAAGTVVPEVETRFSSDPAG